MDERVTYSKALAIILMVVGHSGCSIPYAISLIYTFHMPLFFFFSGYCFKNEYLDKPNIFVAKRIKGIYWPYIKWSLLFLFLHNLFFRLHLYNISYTLWGIVLPYSYKDMYEHFIDIIFMMKGHDQLLGGFWFLKALFYSSLLSFWGIYLIRCLRLKENGFIYSKLVLIVLLLFIVIVFNHTKYIIPYIHLGSQPFVAAVFFLIGHCFAEMKIPKFKRFMVWVAIGVVVMGGAFWRLDMVNQLYDNVLLLPQLVSAICGTWVVYSLPWQKLKGKSLIIMKFIGNNTLTILALHFLSFKIVSFGVIEYLHLPMIVLAEFPVIGGLNEHGGWWIVYSVVGLLIPCCSVCVYRTLKNKFCEM